MGETSNSGIEPENTYRFGGVREPGPDDPTTIDLTMFGPDADTSGHLVSVEFDSDEDRREFERALAAGDVTGHSCKWGPKHTDYGTDAVEDDSADVSGHQDEIRMKLSRPDDSSSSVLVRVRARNADDKAALRRILEDNDVEAHTVRCP